MINLDELVERAGCTSIELNTMPGTSGWHAWAFGPTALVVSAYAPSSTPEHALRAALTALAAKRKEAERA